MEALEEQPTEICYKKWRHKTRGDVVQLVAVHHYRSPGGYYTTVTVQGKRDPHPHVWPSRVFLDTFNPVGRKMKRKSHWERLLDSVFQ